MNVKELPLIELVKLATDASYWLEDHGCLPSDLASLNAARQRPEFLLGLIHSRDELRDNLAQDQSGADSDRFGEET